LIEAAGKIAGVAYNEPDAEVALSQAEQLIATTRARVEQRQSPCDDTNARLLTARELLDKTLSDPRWAIPGFLPAGLTLLAGKPKMGKSWLALGLGLAGSLWGLGLCRMSAWAGDVLYLALEDTERRLQQRMRQLLNGEADISGLERLMFVCQWPRLDHGGVQWLDRWLQGRPSARLVI